MADAKISALTELTSLATDDEFVVVDKSDTTMAASGTNKRVTKATLDALWRDITASASTDDVFTSNVSGDTDPRFNINADGKLEWGDGTGATDVSIVRSGAGAVYCDGQFSAQSGVTSFGGMTCSTDLIINKDIYLAQGNGSGFIEYIEQSDPSAPSANRGRLYLRDNGSGKTQLVLRTNSQTLPIVTEA